MRVYSRAAFNNIFACSCGVYSREAFIRVITVLDFENLPEFVYCTQRHGENRCLPDVILLLLALIFSIWKHAYFTYLSLY